MKEHIGGWCLHNKLSKIPNTIISWSCNICNQKKYKIKKEVKYIYLNSKYSRKEFNNWFIKILTYLCGEYKERTNLYSKVNVIYTKCNGCGNESEIGCISTGEHLFKRE